MRALIHHLIEHQARSRGDASAVTFKSTTLTYAELWRDVNEVAGGLLALGLRRDDRVGVYLDKRLETVTSIFGTSLAGGVFVPVNPLLRPRQVAYIVGDCDVRFLITSTDRLATLAEELRRTPSVEHVVVVDGTPDSSTPREPDPYKVTSWVELIDRGGEVPANRGIDLDMAAILYTSGSTGNPKGVVLSHRNLIVGAESVSSYLENTADDVILSALPLSFDAGFSQLTTAFSVGAHVVLLNYLLPADVVRLCAKHRVTGLTCVPPLWIQIAERTWPTEAAQHLRYFANTGGRMPKATLDALRSHFPGAKPYLMYGLTEAFRSTFLDPEQVDRRPDSIGKAIPNADILVVRPDGTECEPGEEGELVHRGALVALGYWHDPEKTSLRFKPVPGPVPDWRAPEIAVWSGDTVVKDEEGFLYFVGRSDEMIKTSGYRVSPTEIEEVAYTTGFIRDAVAVGVPDPKLGQHIALIVTPRDHDSFDTDAFLAEMRRQVPLYMVPALVDVRDALPLSPNGKFDRNLLQAEMVAS